MPFKLCWPSKLRLDDGVAVMQDMRGHHNMPLATVATSAPWDSTLVLDESYLQTYVECGVVSLAVLRGYGLCSAGPPSPRPVYLNRTTPHPRPHRNLSGVVESDNSTFFTFSFTEHNAGFSPAATNGSVVDGSSGWRNQVSK